jgi:hypothetical protein
MPGILAAHDGVIRQRVLRDSSTTAIARSGDIVLPADESLDDFYKSKDQSFVFSEAAAPCGGLREAHDR